MPRLALRVNGVEHDMELEARRTLVEVLRDDLGLTGTHVGCEHGVCGSCTVLIDGEPARACLALAAQLDGCHVTTVEGLGGADGTLHPVQDASRRHAAFQCGFCTPGILVTMAALLRDVPRPTEAEIRSALGGHLCRCTGYQAIVEAILDVPMEPRP